MIWVVGGCLCVPSPLKMEVGAAKRFPTGLRKEGGVSIEGQHATTSQTPSCIGPPASKLVWVGEGENDVVSVGGNTQHALPCRSSAVFTKIKRV